MVGTGIFTSTGFQVESIISIPAILLTWVLGGVTALCGALTYAELTSTIPDNGGEYQLLTRIYHPAAGFVMGFVSIIVGFAAPCAAVALALGAYLHAIDAAIPATATALASIVLLTATHALNVKAGSGFQNVFTIAKIILIAGMIVAGLIVGDWSRLSVDTGTSFVDGVLSPKFAVGMIYVAFAYSGWNAAAYVAGEVERPSVNLPRSLLIGTVIVTALYVLMNVVFLSAAPSAALSGVEEVGHVASVHLFGETGGKILSGIIGLGLVSTLGAMIMTGARVAEKMGQDYPALSWLSRRTDGGAPITAVILIGVLAAILLASSELRGLLEYTGFTITLGLALTVVGVFVLRVRAPDLPRPYRAWGYPVTPAIYALLSAWMLIGTIIERPIIAAGGAGTIVLGVVTWALIGQRAKP